MKLPGVERTSHRDRYREVRGHVRELEYAARTRELERRAHLLEAVDTTDWVSPYLEIFDRFRTEPMIFAASGYMSRRHGRNAPLARSESELRLLRVPAELLVSTNTYAQGLIEGLTSYVIGSGLTFSASTNVEVPESEPWVKALKAAAQRVLDNHVKRNQYHGGEQPGLIEEAFQRSRIAGEMIIVGYPQSDGTVEERIMESDQLTQPPGTDFREWGFGVCTRPDDAQRHLAYWLQHGDTPADGEEYAADEVSFLRVNVPRNVKRGIPDFAFDAYDAMNLAGRLRTAMAHGTAERAAHSIVTKMTATTADRVNDFRTRNADYQRIDPVTGRQMNVNRVRPGTRLTIGANEDFVSMPGGDPTAIAVLNACILSAGGRWNAPPWLYGGDAAATTSYASSLTAESPFVRTTLRRQRPICEVFKGRAWYALRHWCAIHGGLKIVMPDGVTRLIPWDVVERVIEVQVEAPSPVSADPLRDEQVREVRNRAGVLSVKTWQQQAGLDPDQEQTNFDAYRERNPQAGTPLTVPMDFGGPR